MNVLKQIMGERRAAVREAKRHVALADLLWQAAVSYTHLTLPTIYSV